jgi:endoglucanase
VTTVGEDVDEDVGEEPIQMNSEVSRPATFAGFLRAGDGVLLDGDGREVLLRGVGLGNWLLPEGYMWCLPEHIDSPRRIEAFVEGLVGTERAERFWDRFRDTFIGEEDVRRIAEEGMNHVRLPLNARLIMDEDGHLREEAMAYVDRCIDWCRTHRLWVVLDLHGAPGGQTGTNIDDSPNRRPELFERPHYRELTIHLWTLLATRYRDEPVVAGYDLLNEPLPDEHQYRYAEDLVDLYQELTVAIRAVDPHHLIIYEGTHWATNWSIFDAVWDPNSLLQFHRYWCPPDRPRIQEYLDVRDRLGLPIYMGEGGENNLAWLQTAFQLYEDHGVSWNHWPWKKIDTVTSPCSIVPPPGWPDLMSDGVVDADTAWGVLQELVDRSRLERCTYRPEVVNALLRRAPLTLPATGFSFRGEGRSYATTQARPHAGFRPDDAVTIRHAGGEAPLEFHHTDGRPRSDDEALTVKLEAEDWIASTFTSRGPGPSV